MKLYLPYRGEFGHKVMWHSPIVNADKGEKTVCCEPGDEALYPGAAEYILVDRPDDFVRRERSNPERDWLDNYAARMSDTFDCIYPTNKGKREYFVPRSTVSYGIECDIVVCPRKRKYGSNKNWKLWPEFVERLKDKGYKVFAAGAPDSSFETDCPKAWDYPRFLDASIEAMHSAKACIATDNGLAHLVVVCGRPLFVVTSNRRTCPSYPLVSMKRYDTENHTGSMIDLVDCWDDYKVLLNKLEDHNGLSKD